MVLAAGALRRTEDIFTSGKGIQVSGHAIVHGLAETVIR